MTPSLPIALRGKDSVTWKTVSSAGLYGPTYTSTSLTGLRISRRSKLLRRQNSGDVVSVAHFATLSAVKVDDLITLDGIDRPVLDVAAIPDGSGSARFYEVFL
jgi:hypothetical protein